MPGRPPAPAAVPLGAAIVGDLPVPALREGEGALPRFRSELGLFIGLSAAAGTSFINGGFAADETQGGVVGDLEMAVRFGLGLAGVLDEAGDGTVYLDVGLRQDTSTSTSFSPNEGLAQGGAITAAIPARGAYTLRVRAPFWLVPGDLLLAALFVAPFSKHTFLAMAAEATNGGLIPWQVGLDTRVGRFQFVLGREVRISFYGYDNADRMLMSPAEPDASARLVSLRSIAFEFPIVEYRPFRTFSMDQASLLKLQVVGGFENANHLKLIAPEGEPLPELHTVYTLGLRIAFDWRHY
jgi:hypothetical protein